MSAESIITSAALYFRAEDTNRVPLRWFERVRDLFTKWGLSPILFSADGGGFLGDECNVLAEGGGDIVDEDGYVLAARAEELVEALRNGEIENLSLDTPRTIAAGRSEWRAAVSFGLIPGEFYIGAEENLAPDASALIQRACGIAKDLINVRYGIAYKLPLSHYPDGHASGLEKTSLSEAVDGIRHRREWVSRTKSADELWREELFGERRHLTGLFRGAYPVSVLSEAHLRGADLLSRRVGKVLRLDSSLWLWELSDAEFDTAQQLLDRRDVLVVAGRGAARGEKGGKGFGSL